MRFKFIPSIIGLVSVIFSNNMSFAADIDLETIRHSAEAFVQTQITPPKEGELSIEAAQLDSRLRFSHCSEPLETSLPGKQEINNNATVLVRCNHENWQVYVPVRVQLLLPRVVASVPLGRGMVLSPSNLTVALIESRFQRGAIYQSPQALFGAKVKRNVKIGEAVQANDICMVCRNDKVVISAGQPGLKIITQGTALSDGTLGEQIRVKNNRSNKIISAQVSAVGEVDVSY
ncbi:TPA: flagellar basal body P-ring formation chaperone FlgA [Photobacterium damselae]|uniref:Flagella basal body P-ring formation protein FlgA n=1 Tax=Photobacterium damselae TaxID=38293 RepID=A0ACD3SU69_PHODM|nr:flagellar basal body P-ring formation chaperone FlgA [Photobacterium damselae]ELI6446837.1 flagellar basal body P-ring formation protein FlgA [Photobacterium damselae]RDL29414.1 flagella basal body P-ring formation protein FlgA [Photobacterium damselae]TMX54791.1 flagella basal body P-ring formation protein FlgA [Photobacterium damselae]TMX62843.1 flagella basal body P-ring formation protein FlgA [Photobacterium damselae]TMX70703.1 flagella basal body P-ring formation protein FlgA [Photobac